MNLAAHDLHQMCVGTGWLTAHVRWKRWDLPHPPTTFGQWALAQRLHSTGSDFTSSAGNLGRSLPSFLRRLWRGDMEDGVYARTDVWTLHDAHDQAIGVVAWEIPRAENVGSGRVNMWLAPKWRRRGLMQTLVREHVAPLILREQHTHPTHTVLAANASISLLAQAGVRVAQWQAGADDFPPPRAPLRS